MNEHISCFNEDYIMIEISSYNESKSTIRLFLQVWFSNRRAKWRRHQRMSLIKAKRNALMDMEAENRQKNSRNGTNCDNVNALKALSHESSGFQISALLNRGNNLENSNNDDQESNYTSSDMSEEIIVTTDDEGSISSSKAYYYH